MKKRILIVLLLWSSLSYAQVGSPGVNAVATPTESVSVDSTEIKAMQTKLDQLEAQRKNDSIQQEVLQAELVRLSTLTNGLADDSTRLDAASIKRNIIKARLNVSLDLSNNLHYLPEGAPVLGTLNDTLFSVYASSGGMLPEERASRISSKIKALCDDDFFDANNFSLEEFDGAYDLIYNKSIILHVSPLDAQVYGLSTQRLASDLKWLITDAVNSAKKDSSLLKWLFRIALACFVLLILVVIVKLIKKGYRKMLYVIARKKVIWFKGLSYRSYTFLTPEREFQGAYFVLRLLSWGFYLISFYLTLPILFRIFPFSRGWSDVLFGLIWSPFKNVFIAIWNYFPNLFSIIAIYFFMNYVIKFVKYIFLEIETGKLKVSGFHIDWAHPTYQIVRFLLYAFMFVMIFPFLPNSDSDIFKGVSMFLGLLLSLGSSSAISNMVSGLVITYMRPFMIGDRIKINDVSGDVIEKTLLVTRIRTVKNEIITIPNSSVLTGNTTNYTFEARTKGLIIYTSVTIGYDVPWKDMHAALIEAAVRTPMIQAEPKPFVLQTSLEDFYVSYQLNGYTREASKQAIIYSQLHANIQDVCNERGIEILSPHYRAARDGNATTIPANYLPEDYEAPAFKVEHQEKSAQSK